MAGWQCGWTAWSGAAQTLTPVCITWDLPQVHLPPEDIGGGARASAFLPSCRLPPVQGLLCLEQRGQDPETGTSQAGSSDASLRHGPSRAVAVRVEKRLQRSVSVYFKITSMNDGSMQTVSL